MELQQAQRKNVKIKLGLQGSSGSGKSFSALLLSYGLWGNWSKVAVIDAENHSAELYAHLGAYNVVNLTPPFSPERYKEAIELCVKAQMEVIVIDSLSLEWDYILEQHGQLAGNSYTNWAKFTPRHQQLFNAILQADAHVICTLRTKQDYVLNEKNGKHVPEKVGMKPIQREGVDYDLTLVFELDIKHNAIATKDRTGLFVGKPEFTISAETGKAIIEWCQQGVVPEPNYQFFIDACESVEDLRELYMSVSAETQKQYRSEFNQRKQQLQAPTNQTVTPQPFYPNGTTNHL